MKHIEFLPSLREVEQLVQPPFSGKKATPKWHKEMPFFRGGKPVFDNGEVTNMSAAACMPFFDAMSGGYIQTLWVDVHIQQHEEGFATYDYPAGPRPISMRDSVSIPISERFYKAEFLWSQAWIPKLPKGYSALITHPQNRIDLPFFTLSGVIDSDRFFHTPMGNTPFYIDKDFSGVIPAGTPIYQILPFKRESWKSKYQKWNEEDRLRLDFIKRKKFFGVYRKRFYVSKTYK